MSEDAPDDQKKVPDLEDVLFEEDGDLEAKKESSLLPSLPYPEQLYVLPLNRRPFFPGMAAPIIIETGAYYEVLKVVSKTDHKCLGLFLTHQEDVNIYKIGFVLLSVLLPMTDVGSFIGE